MGPRVWLLNLDADLELGTNGPYTSSDRVRRASEAPRAILTRTLVPSGDAIATDAAEPGSFSGYEGRCFCPTPNALARLRELGASVVPSPPRDVLRRVARRDFDYASELDGALATTDLDEVLVVIARRAPGGDGWRLKRAFGMASRGHRVVRGEPSTTDVAFVRASTDGLIVEPNVAIVRELGLHGYLHADGTFARGAPTEQTMDAYGAWRETHALEPGALTRELGAALGAALERAAAALHAASYFGPFGIDAFEYRDGARTRLRRCSEIHARYSMGWAFGWPEGRPDLA